jgi:hypothetical protein
MKKQFIIMLFSAIVAKSANSQEINTDSISKTQKKNELWLNLTPAIIVLSGNYPYDSEFSLYYKRNLNKGWLRLGVEAINYAQPLISQQPTYKVYNDTIRILEFNNHKQNSYTGNLGWEYRFKGLYLTKYMGTDLKFIYEQYFRINSEWIQTLDTLTGLWTSANSGGNWTPPALISEYQALRRGIGISAFAGVILPLSAKFSLAAQSNLLGTYMISNVEVTNYTRNQNWKYTVNTFNFRQRILHQINLVYRF